MLHIKHLINCGLYNEALVSLNECIAQDSQNDEAYYLRGNVYRKMERYGDALNDYNKAVEINPQSPAKVAMQILNNILAYRCTDLLNP